VRNTVASSPSDDGCSDEATSREAVGAAFVKMEARKGSVSTALGAAIEGA
jgi:hypothetical protein